MGEALLKPLPLVQPPEPEKDRDGEGEIASPVKLVCFMLLAFSFAIVLGAMTSFLVFSFTDLVMLFRCLRQYARTPPLASSPRRELLMAAWLLAWMLVVTFFQVLELWFLAMGKTY